MSRARERMDENWSEARERRDEASVSSLSFTGIEDSIVSELRVNVDNELQVRVYLRMTHQRIRRVPQ